MIKISDKTKCTGCHACFDACPTKSIVMKVDSEGFWYPSVQEETCIHCDRCEKVCPVIHCNRQVNDGQNVYAAFAKDERIRRSGSSGGIFTLLAEYVLSQGGVVFGAAFDSSFQVRHMVVQSKEELVKLQESKYVQSKIGNTYSIAEEYLKKGVAVLFSGTPCQIAGLKSYLGKEYDTLITQDLVCHGVPSPLVWNRYLAWEQAAEGKEIANFSFRNKDSGWRQYSVVIQYKDGTQKRSRASKHPMMRAYLSDACLRPSCYSCPNKGKDRSSDLTLADFWNVGEFVPAYDDNKGVSLVVCNTLKGERLFEAVLAKVEYQKVKKEVLDHNIPFNCSAQKPLRRQAFMQAIHQMPFEEAVKKYCDPNFIVRVISKSRAVLQKWKSLEKKKAAQKQYHKD